jgi:pyruvate dehydrogenase E2 component (dihydrolipoamide acetyltransferase)
MISEVVMPQMGADMTEGTVVRWLKKEGDPVERGEIIAEIETDKANVEIEAFESGVFRKLFAQEGDTIAVGQPIAVIASPDDDISKYEAAPAGAKQAAPAKSEPQAAPAEANIAVPKSPPQATPAAPAEANIAAPKSPPQATPAAPAEANIAAPPAGAARPDGVVRASPVARKLAQEKGIDLAQVRGSGPDGRIVRHDVEAAIERAGAPAPRPAATAPPAAATPAPAAGTTVIQQSRMRQTIARRMSQSKREAPHYYITAEIDMTEAEHERHQINDALHRDVHVSINDLIVKASAMALAQHPIFNTWFVDGQVQQHTAINVCVAIALDDGLIAPAILDCGAKSLREISQASKSLIERAKSGALKPEEYSGGTFTISNLGPYDVETLIAIIQPPQTAILGVGSVREMPVVREGQVVVAQMIKAALSADHRVTDGAQGAQFLHEIRKLLENPAALLI